MIIEYLLQGPKQLFNLSQKSEKLKSSKLFCFFNTDAAYWHDLMSHLR